MEVIEKTRWEGEKIVGIKFKKTQKRQRMKRRGFEVYEGWKDQKRRQMEQM